MKLLKVLFVFALTAAAANSQTFQFSSCPQPSTQKDFNVTKYMGTWYEIEKLPTLFQKGKCCQATYTPLADGTVSVHNAEILSDGNTSSIEGVAKIKDPSQPAILGVSFFKGLPEAPYWVLTTDYQSYALVYSCSGNLGFFHFDFAWILARTRVLAEDIISQLRDKLAADTGIDVNRLTVTDQTGCDVLT